MQGNVPRVSVIIPLFNKERWVMKTLESAYYQSHTNIEIIVIDDGSTDLSLNRVELFRSRLKRTNNNSYRNLIILSRPNMGQISARQFGASMASGTFLAFLDADDYWHHKKISQQLSFFEQNPAKQAVLSNYLIVDSNGRLKRAVNFSPLHIKLREWLMTTGSGGLIESTGLIRKDYFFSVGGFSTEVTMGSGLLFAFEAYNNNKLGLVDKYLCIYRMLDDGWHSNYEDLTFSQGVIVPRLLKYDKRSQDCAFTYLQEYVFWKEMGRTKKKISRYLSAPFIVLGRGVSSMCFAFKIGYRITHERLLGLVLGYSRRVREFVKLSRI